MGRLARVLAVVSLGLAGAAVWMTAAADETSTGDKLRILYSNQFTFDDRGIPLITVELATGEERAVLGARSGLVVLPDGDGGSQVLGGSRWTVTVDAPKPAVIRDWTVVDRLDADDERGALAAMKRWRARGFEPRRFEVGTIFGVDGEVIDSRELLVAVDPVAHPGGGKRAHAIANKYKIDTSVHPEMVRRPQGTIVARSGDVILRNPSVIWFRPKRSNDTVEVDDIVAGRGGSQLATKRERRRYWGSVYVTIGTDGKLVVVNAVSADQLLAGLVPSEIFADAADEALAAQAIAARTELLEKIGTRHLTDPYLLCSSQHCQVYSGAGHEHPRTTRAVRRTRGRILLRDGGGLVDARYSASCGGHGEHNDHVWGDPADPSLRGRVDAEASSGVVRKFSRVTDKNIGEFLSLPSTSAWCGRTRYGKGRFRWSKRVSAAELQKRIEARYPGVGAPRAFEPLERGVSGRISRLRITGARRTIVVRGDLHIRRLLGGLRSSLFTVKPIGDAKRPAAFEFRGAGFGHGVGMCQTGAIGMAENGKKVGEILHHYYPGSHVKRLY
jgi:SpoIID/LytB domain protein